MYQEIFVTCADGVRLAATHYAAQTPLEGAVLIGPATGVKRQFYHHFAMFLAQQGYTVMTYDNRGIGGSLAQPIGTCRADLVQWGSLDMPAVLSALQARQPQVPCFLVGHSAGGQLAGLMHNASELQAIFNFGSSSGRLKNMPLPYRFKAHFFMNCFIPLSNLLFGHTKAQWVNMGEPLPSGVASQWRRWCNGQGYAKTDFGQAITCHWYDQLSLPMRWVIARDDEIANEANVKDMMQVYSAAEAQFCCLDKGEFQLAEIGHMKFFSRNCSVLWPMVTEFFTSQMAASAMHRRAEKPR